MPNTWVTPWAKPTTQHNWYVAPTDEKRDYNLTRKYRQSIIDKSVFWGTRFSPTWSYWGPPAFWSAGLSYWAVQRHQKPFWMQFLYFPAYYASLLFVIRYHREFYFEYQIHKVLTWGQHELGHAKRRMAAGKESPVPTSERRTKEDWDCAWKHGSHLM
eukprot:TRINITY_DN431_c0_g1_i1.p1 TRINITY_DN431_c0_g1~~TRINITY_DN431_c0_g1_i1.p1  ORF type:complete len:158 (+),score=44.17 TRINITY_DN431_c0_g1_i1:48-521(+)